MRKLVTLAVMGVAISGCATKNYGRLQPLSGTEMAMYDCREIIIEQAKVGAFEDGIKEKSSFNGKSALADLGDFGIGNSMEKGSAEKSAIERRRQLDQLYAEKNCQSTVATAPAAPSSPH